MFENPRTGRRARNFSTKVSKILVLKSFSEQIFSENWTLGAPVKSQKIKRQVIFILQKLFTSLV